MTNAKIPRKMGLIDKDFLYFIKNDHAFRKLSHQFCGLFEIDDANFSEKIYDEILSVLKTLDTIIVERATAYPDSSQPLNKNNFSKSDVMRAFVLLANPNPSMLNKIIHFFLSKEEEKIAGLNRSGEKKVNNLETGLSLGADFLRGESLLKNMLAHQVHYDPVNGERNKQRSIKIMKERITLDRLNRTSENDRYIDWEKRFEHAFNTLKIALNLSCMHKAYYLRELYHDAEKMLIDLLGSPDLTSDLKATIRIFLQKLKRDTIVVLDHGLSKVDEEGRLIELSYERIVEGVTRTIQDFFKAMGETIFEEKKPTLQNKVKKELNQVIIWINLKLNTKFNKFCLSYEDRFFKILEKRQDLMAASIKTAPCK